MTDMLDNPAAQDRRLSPDLIDLADLATKLWQQRWLVLAGVVIGFLLAVYQVHRTTFVYTAELKVAPAQTGESGRAPSLGGLGGLAARAGLGLGPVNSTTTFALYKEGLTTRSLAAAVAAKPDIMHVIFAGEWNAEEQRYVEPKRGLIGRISQSLKSILGYPDIKWEAPNAARMQDYITSAVKVSDNVETGVTTLTYAHPDPAFAARFLMEIHSIADANLRRKARLRAAEYIEYLSRQLQTISLLEHRTAIATALSEQEKVRMAASSTLAYAAEPLDVATPTLRPTAPRPTMMLIFGLLGGFAAGIGLALVRALRPIRRAPEPASS